MKRFTSFLMATLVATLSFAQAAPFSAFRPGKVADVAPITVNGTLPKLPASLAAKQAKAKAKAGKKVVKSVNDLEGSYEWEFELSNEYSLDLESLDTEPGSVPVVASVVDADAGTLNLAGMFPNDLTVTLLEDGFIEIKEQEAGTSQYGKYDVSGLFYYEGDDEYEAGWYLTDIYGYIEDDGTILFDGVWFIRLLSEGIYKGYSLTPYWVEGSALVSDEAPAPEGKGYTIAPAEGEVEKLETFNIAFDDYLVDVNEDEASAILFNTETEAEIEATFIGSIAGGRQVYIAFPEVTAPGEYELIVLDGSIQKTIDGSYLPELSFKYTIKGSDGIQGVNVTNGVRYFDATGRTMHDNAKGLLIRQTRKADGALQTTKVIRK